MSRLPLALVLCIVALPVLAVEPAAPEKLLHGEWKGGPCCGDWTFQPDGSYDLRHYTPGRNHLTGTWKLQWDALPPKLVLTCKTTDDAERLPVGLTWEVKVLQLDKTNLVYQHPGSSPLTWTREPSPIEKELSELQGTWTPLYWEQNGERLEARPRHVFAGDKLTIQINGETIAEGKVVVDATQSPKHLDLQMAGGPTHSLIYARAGDYVIYCGNRTGQRPTEFATGTAHGGEYLMAWKIEK
jgi:uncharacterized protein (TIGR03067 family)